MKKILTIITLILICVLAGCKKTSSTFSETTISQATTLSSESTTKIVDSTTTEIISSTEGPTTTESNITSTEDDTQDLFDMESYLEGFNERRELLANYMVESYPDFSKISPYAKQKYGFLLLGSYFYKYESTKDETYLNTALALMDECYDGLDKYGDWFGATQGVFAYGLFKKYFTPELLEKAEKSIKETSAYSCEPSTPNLSLASAVGCYLANQMFPGEVTHNYGGYPHQDYVDYTGEVTVKQILDKYFYFSVYEFNSNTYFNAHMIPLFALAILSSDENVRKKASMVIENSLFQLAPIWLDGHMCVSMARTYNPCESQVKTGQVNYMLWYYFGGEIGTPSYKDLESSEGYNLGLYVYLDYLPNWMSVAIANDKEEAFTHLEMHNEMNSSRYFTAYMKSYINKTYGVFSSKITISGSSTYLKHFGDASDLETRYGCYRLLQNWGVKWKRENTSDLSTFIIENYMQETNGTSAYSQVLQHEDTVIGIFNVPEGYKYGGLFIYEPDGELAVIDDSYIGKVLIHYGDIIIAYKLSTSFVHSSKENSTIRTNPITQGYFVCEVIDASEVEGDTPEEQLLYAESMLEGSFRSIKFNNDKLHPSITYTNIDGIEMYTQFGGDDQAYKDTIDGEQIVYALLNYPLQDNPWVKNNYGDKNVTYSYKGHSITFDYTNLTTIIN